MGTKNAIILASGGIDSVVAAYYVKKRMNYKNLIFLFFDYRQKTKKQEEYYSRANASNLKAGFMKINLQWLSKISRSLILHGKNKAATRRDINTPQEMLLWYAPARNTIFLSYALALAESLFLRKKRYDIFLGFKNEGKMHYPDTTQSFINEFNKLKKKAVMGNFSILAPLIKYDKDEVILLGKKLGVDFKDTYSCYHGSVGMMHCGICMNCRLRQEAFYWANLEDPTKYKNKAKDHRDLKYLTM